MKRRTQILLVVAALVGAAAISSMNREGHFDAGSRGGGASCPCMSGVSLWSTNPWVAVESTNGKAGVRASETITNRQR